MFSFYRETTPEPPHPPPDDEQPMREYLQLQLKQGGNAPIFGTPIVSPRFHEASNELLEKPFEHEFERVQEQERSRRSSRSSASRLPAGASTEATAAASPVVATGETGPSDSVASRRAAPHQNLPVELWELIFSFLAVNADDDSYQPLGDLFSCILTCRVCT
jgi:hypothetical protein